MGVYSLVPFFVQGIDIKIKVTNIIVAHLNHAYDLHNFFLSSKL